MTLRTAHFSYSGPDRADITFGRRSGDNFWSNFAPTWAMVQSIKNTRNAPEKEKKKAEEKYKSDYAKLIASRISKNPDIIATVFERFREVGITLVCFCGKDEFCHRKLLASIFESWGLKYEGEYKKPVKGEEDTKQLFQEE